MASDLLIIELGDSSWRLLPDGQWRSSGWYRSDQGERVDYDEVLPAGTMDVLGWPFRDGVS